MRHHLFSASHRHMDDGDAGADVSAASQHPRLSRAAILPLFFHADWQWKHPPVDPPSSSLSLLLTHHWVRTHQLCSAPLLKLRLDPSSHGGFSMYGCAGEKDAVGWAKTPRRTHKPVCCGHPRRRNQRIGALFWMGRGSSLCARRVWVAEVRRGSSGLFLVLGAEHRGAPWQRQARHVLWPFWGGFGARICVRWFGFLL